MFVNLLLPLCVCASLSVPLSRQSTRGHTFLRQTAEVSDFMDEQYYVQVQLGSQYFNLLVDTGSSNIWVPSASCYSMPCWAHNTYTPSSNSYFNGAQIAIQYESGYCSGQLVSDYLTISSLLVNVTFGAMSIVSPQFTHVQFDGILGLAWPALSVDSVPTFFDALMAQGQLASNSFSLYITGDSDSSQSQLVFGEPDTSLYVGELTSIPVASKNYWSVEVTSVVVGVRDKIDVTNTIAVIESGTSGIAGTELVIAEFEKLIVVSSDCSNMEQLPSITIELGGKSLTITPANYVITSTVGDVTTCSSPFQVVGMSVAGRSALILGTSFLRGVFTYFDFDNSAISFATRANQ